MGDAVLATQPETGETAAKRVEATIIGDGDKSLVDVTIATDTNNHAVVTATDQHPFWVPELSDWIDAANLQAGQWLQTSAGTRTQITAVEHRTDTTRVHNLTVVDIHTYYVLAGNTPVLVHNCPDSIRGAGSRGNPIDDWSPATFGSADESAIYHLNKHGKGRTLVEYTAEARALWDKTPTADRVPWELGDGSVGWKIRGGFRGGEGIYTNDGKIVTWHD
ncbi:polymorphic toxin-type HINT domain-containing protein [Micromonospora sp. LOL_023]|uniref:polymorphic toxin-type HINT domain-containing protein n=1 Tax=Micromonospora sp. LOL_023 TaxID=3345418 RepID=UPI003A8890DC